MMRSQRIGCISGLDLLLLNMVFTVTAFSWPPRLENPIFMMPYLFGTILTFYGQSKLFSLAIVCIFLYES